MAREQLQTLTEPMYYILLSLTRERCGVDIMNRVKEISRGRITIGPGTLYAMLQRFETLKIVQITRRKGRQKWYITTEKGRRMLEEEINRLMVMIEDVELMRE